jgi:hypothetical protein
MRATSILEPLHCIFRVSRMSVALEAQPGISLTTPLTSDLLSQVHKHKVP